MSQPSKPTNSLPARLGVGDVAAITAGIIIGAGIYETTPQIAGNVASAWTLMAMWTLGGVIALNGALCYAELSSAYPRQGGTYVYLNKAFGPWAGFLYAWCEMWVVRPANIGAMAFIFAKYAAQIVPQADELMLVRIAILALAGINLLGIQAGRGTQFALTATKVGGLIAIFFAGMYVMATAESAAPAIVEKADSQATNYFLALVLILFTYGGWNETAAVAAEVRQPERNMLRGLVLGTGIVIATYLLVNIALIGGLGFRGLAGGEAVVTRLVTLAVGDIGGKLISIAICLSCLGAINGMLFTGARVYYALGVDEPAFRWLGHWNQRLGTPVRALVLQTVVSLALIELFGRGENAFVSLVVYSSPVFWLFLLLVSIAVIVLREHDGQTPRPFRLPLFPLEPLLFFAASGMIIYSSINWILSPYRERSPIEGWLAAATYLPVLAGLAVALFLPRKPAERAKL